MVEAQPAPQTRAEIKQFLMAKANELINGWDNYPTTLH